jgi:hypothetical protein
MYKRKQQNNIASNCVRRARDQVNTRSYLTILYSTRLRLTRTQSVERVWKAGNEPQFADCNNMPFNAVREKCIARFKKKIINVFLEPCVVDWKKRQGEWWNYAKFADFFKSPQYWLRRNFHSRLTPCWNETGFPRLNMFLSSNMQHAHAPFQ